ncbi:hypothetical protein Poli38472_011745 [Pythium oligandrum]|uniref:Uncharacterized protein n=1 Tax=Pythium oligandrum TaxID=41045 RepID=A0A8K1FFZ0_PYTOL|nr:hypothetical protein Poli38472_011745 [Pythium oligandrum]|eukprot:TMW58157.1 hypothetical protein Poli38472_011745 [Pythium oligandrum]
MADDLQEHATQEPEPLASSQSFRVSSAKFHNAKSLRVISGNIRSTHSLRVISGKLHSEVTWVGKVWNRLQVELHGRFSTQRINAMSDYHSRTSWWRAVLVCIVTPLPALFTITALDIAPVKPPTDGSNANYVYWIPIPVLLVFMRAIWTRPLKENPAQLKALHSQLFAFAGQCVMTYSHALYFFAFTSMTRSQQSIFIFGLPVLKICLKNYISRMLRRLEDVKPAFILFNIDVFSALYVANCLQSSQSWINTMLIMLVDIVQIGVSITDIRAINREIRSLTPTSEQSISLFDLYQMATTSPESQKDPHAISTVVPSVQVAPRGPNAESFF